MAGGDVEDRLGELGEEIEDSRLGPLVLPEGLVVHEQVAQEPVAVDLVDPLREFLGRERPLRPASVAEPERDVVVVLGQGETRQVQTLTDADLSLEAAGSSAISAGRA